MMTRTFGAVACLSLLLGACLGKADPQTDAGTPATDGAGIPPAEGGEGGSAQVDGGEAALTGELLPTGARITPTAASGSSFQRLNPGLVSFPDYVADHAVTTALSPDGATLLVLTSGYNRMNNDAGVRDVTASNEYVFIYDVTTGAPVQKQVVQVPNTFTGLAWNPRGTEFYVSGGVNDNVHVFAEQAGGWASASVIALGHAAGIGIQVAPASAGLAVNASGTRVIVTNYYNDSVSIVDVATRAVIAELDLRPGKIDPSAVGVPGGEYPSWVAVHGDAKAYVSSQRDNEVVVLDLTVNPPVVIGRVKVGSQPNRMVLNRAGSRLFVANANSDTVSVIDTRALEVIEHIATTAPAAVYAQHEKLKGSNPNSVALSPDETSLYVTNGGTNSLAIVDLGAAARGSRRGEGPAMGCAEDSRVRGLVPTGWYPNSVTVSADGQHLYIVNGKSVAGPNPRGCRDNLGTTAAASVACRSANQYVWQLEKAGLLALPVPGALALDKLTWQVAHNNHFPAVASHAAGEAVMRQIGRTIKHVVYIIKENRTYDQVLGDLAGTNGDPSLTLFPQSVSPNHHALASQFVALDNFLDSGETSGVGWNWTTAGRTTDSIEKTQPVNYAGRGLAYDWEGTNRNVNVGIPTLAGRIAAMPHTPPDPDLLPGTADVASHALEDNEVAAYLWDAALKAGLTVRNYGCFGDGARYSLPVTDPAYIPLERTPAAAQSVQFIPAKESLATISAPYFRGYDMKYPDYWRYKEWEREFDEHVANGNFPNLELVRLPHDHLGSFTTAIDGVNTPETQMADNDYAVGLLVDKIANSRYADSTLVFVIEDDAQDGNDHVDAHRSIALVAGPFVKKNAVISTAYNTVNMVRTIESVLGLEPMGLTDGLAAPMADLFDTSHGAREWTYQAIVPAVLRTTALPLPPATAGNTLPPLTGTAFVFAPRHSASYWERAMAGQNFEREDDLDAAKFNQALWQGLKGNVRRK